MEAVLHEQIDELEAVMVQSGFPLVHCPLKHLLTDRLYSRHIFMPAGSLITSLIHLTEHPFFILYGKVSVLTEAGMEVLEAPDSGVTRSGTRRVLYCHTDVIWVTVHARENWEMVDDIKDRIIDKRQNPLLEDEIRGILSQLHIDLPKNDSK